MKWINHRFKNELEELENNPISGNYNQLVIGTFNPADVEGIENLPLWYYARPENVFWALLPQLLGHPSLHVYQNLDKSLLQLDDERKEYCTTNKIIMTDIYKAVFTDLKNKSDDAIKNPEKHIPFDYAKAFAHTTFNGVVFTRKTWDKKTVMGKLLQQAADYFTDQNTPVYYMKSPSPRVKGTMPQKLAEWKEIYNWTNSRIIIKKQQQT